ncbi:AI-2E family transporter [Rhizobium sp. KVB221]|uniref:AI-2E family transporter n=1 Tax=Rhizobium setariae TaxID=2801340 RepID=A0A936YLI0_9HYPH|nr:AI-2E family transporter [Rhizobium setariae]MBL0372659.1 AI-2E family transporter [Rhizobium setariae]
MAQSDTEETVIAAKPVDFSKRISRYLAGIFLLLLVYGLYIGRDFLTPVILAFLLALTLTPIVRFLSKWAVPPALSATILIVVSAGAITILAYVTSGPVSQLVADAPQISAKLQERIHSIRRTVDKAVEATSQIDSATETITDGNVQKVVVAQPGILSRAAGSLLSIGTTLAITLVLSLFLLSSGTLFYEKLIQSFSLMSDKKRALRVVYSVEREISRYLFTITLINAGLGIAVGGGLWLLGIPNAMVWGVAAAVLNFLPYVGALATIVLVAIISLVTFENIVFSLLAPAFVLCCNIVEGQFVTPLLLGRRLELNPVAVFLSISFWSWIWGFVGALLAVPLLVVIKVVCDHFETLKPFGNFLSAQQPSKVPAEE